MIIVTNAIDINNLNLLNILWKYCSSILGSIITSFVATLGVGLIGSYLDRQKKNPYINSLNSHSPCMKTFFKINTRYKIFKNFSFLFLFVGIISGFLIEISILGIFLAAFQHILAMLHMKTIVFYSEIFWLGIILTMFVFFISRGCSLRFFPTRGLSNKSIIAYCSSKDDHKIERIFKLFILPAEIVICKVAYNRECIFNFCTLSLEKVFEKITLIINTFRIDFKSRNLVDNDFIDNCQFNVSHLVVYAKLWIFLGIMYGATLTLWGLFCNLAWASNVTVSSANSFILEYQRLLFFSEYAEGNVSLFIWFIANIFVTIYVFSCIIILSFRVTKFYKDFIDPISQNCQLNFPHLKIKTNYGEFEGKLRDVQNKDLVILCEKNILNIVPWDKVEKIEVSNINQK